MRADNSRALREAARRKAEAAQSRAVAAIDAARESGGRVTFSRIASEAQVSRGWLYRQTSLRSAIIDMRAAGVSSVPFDQRSSAESRGRRIEDLLEVNRRLREELAAERKRVERLLGELREIKRQSPRDSQGS